MKQLIFVITITCITFNVNASPPMNICIIMDSATQECNLKTFELLWQFDSCGEKNIKLNIFKFFPKEILNGLSYERIKSLLGSPFKSENYEFGNHKKAIQADYILKCDSNNCCPNELVEFFKEDKNYLDLMLKKGTYTILQIYIIDGKTEDYSIIEGS